MRRGISSPIIFSASVALAFVTLGCVSKKAPAPITPLAAAVGGAPATPATSAPAAAAQPEPFSLKPGEQLVPHTVAKGESLWVLAQKYNTRVSRIKSANGMTSDLINEGRTLQIPTTGGAVASDPVAEPAPIAAPAPPAPAAAAPSLFQTAPAPAPAPTAPSTGGAPSLNFGTPAAEPAPAAPEAPGSGGIKFQDN